MYNAPLACSEPSLAITESSVVVNSNLAFALDGFISQLPYEPKTTSSALPRLESHAISLPIPKNLSRYENLSISSHQSTLSSLHELANT